MRGRMRERRGGSNLDFTLNRRKLLIYKGLLVVYKVVDK